MSSRLSFIASIIALISSTLTTPARAQEMTVDPYPTPIETKEGVVAVNFVEFAKIPDVNGEAPRMMHLVNEPSTNRIFVSLMTGALHSLSYDGKVVTQYLDISAPAWGVRPPGT